MAGTINYLYDPAQTVWVITDQCVEDGDNGNLAIREGVVKYVDGQVLTTGTTITYGVQLVGQSGNIEFAEADVFPDLATALTEYGIRIA